MNMLHPRPVIHYNFTAHNLPSSQIPQATNSFTLSAPPQTDLWRKPPGTDTSTCPLLLKSMRFPFVSAEVSVAASWALEWDQAGLVLFAGPPPAVADIDAPPPYSARTKWIKAGLELSAQVPHASCTIASDSGADWTVTSLGPAMSQRQDLRVKLERLGQALWVYYEDERGGWRKYREVTGFFCGVEDKQVRVGVYASRPAGLAGGGERCLTVEFMDLLIF